MMLTYFTVGEIAATILQLSDGIQTETSGIVLYGFLGRRKICVPDALLFAYSFNVPDFNRNFDLL